MTIVLLIAGLGIVLTPAARAGAFPSCDNYNYFTDIPGQGVYVPTVGQGWDADCLLGVGNYNNRAVTQLQWNLDQCYGANLQIDADFGPLTEAALQRAQRSAGIMADGVYGPQTRDNILWKDASGNCARLGLTS